MTLVLLNAFPPNVPVKMPVIAENSSKLLTMLSGITELPLTMEIAAASAEYTSSPVIGWQCALMRYIVPPVDEPIAGTFGWRYLPMSWAEFQSAPRLIS